MADIQTVTQDDRPLFTCLSCSIAFLTAEEQRTTLFHSLAQTELIASRGSLSLGPPQVQHEASRRVTSSGQRCCFQPEGAREEARDCCSAVA